MKSFMSFIKKTLIVGLSFLVPAVLLVYLIVKVLGIIRQGLAPIANKINISFLGRETSSRIIATLVLLILCFIIGLMVKKKKNSPIKDWIEDNILSNVPAYSLLKGMTEQAVGFDSKHLKEVVLINMGSTWRIGFLMERIDEDLNTVFIPSAPKSLSGIVAFVKWDALKKLDMDEMSVMKLHRKLGVDSKKILNGRLNKSMFDN